MLRILSAVLVIAGCAVPVRAQTGLTYRYKSENGTGQVWVLGENARRQLDARGNGPLGGHVEIWRSGGKEHLMLDPAQRTYHDVIAHRAASGVSGATMPELPFDHAIALRSTHPDVDKVLVPRLLELKGIPVFRLLKVTRKIEGGEQTSATLGLLLTDIREVPVPADRFRVPAGYRRVEPAITPPSLK